ncbi:diguanylate cyclase [Cognatiyoonia sp. IB215446]|uniref:GGDEF domain-containing protein n=1 Tax=Cognatiyoonia sp. IB215446 TaxID=3097355 RepID=UPI002A122841|nr:diguanylate cyclase [Cognatiyoonia sp. IB215446]MDX8346679.1 diguanylate cyclase [Cognatiyoonia sp. IB215446]
MLPAFENMMLVVQPIALAVLVIYLYGLFSRSLQNRHILNSVMGGMLGFAAIAAMSSPIPIADGVIVDIRNLFIGVAAAFFGAVGGIIALVLAATMRISIGGYGMFLGVTGMFVAGLMAWIWGHALRQRIKNENLGLFVLAIMISLQMLTGLFLPPAVRTSFFLGLGPTLLLANLIGAFLLGKLIARERALIAEAKRLENEATTDPLTKLINRQTATAAFRKLPRIEDPSQGQAMLCIDVDSFKGINDSHGHVSGDRVLVEIAKRLSDCLRPVDIVSRLSGDEFVIILHAVTANQALSIAERCRQAIGTRPMTFDSRILRPSISVGAVWTQLPMSFNAFREKADDALYQSKSDGRNCVTFEIHSEPKGFVAAAVA